MLKVEVYRYNPDTDSAPKMESFDVDTGGKDLMVLDVLALIKEKDEGFSYRRSCREGVCGSDGMNMNGKNGLACTTAIDECAGKQVQKHLGWENESPEMQAWREGSA